MRLLFREIQYVRKHKAKSLILGTTTKNGVAISCNVFVYSRETGMLLSRTQSDQNGNYLAFGMSGEDNYIVATDPDKKINIAAQDNVI